MNKNITQLAKVIQSILTANLDEIGKATGFIKRKVKIEAGTFIQILVTGFLSNPELTYGEMSQAAAIAGLEISPQGLEQRFTPEAANFVQIILEKIVSEVMIQVESVEMPVLERFKGVYLRDSSVIQLPRELKKKWRGNGGNKGENSAMKLQVCMNYSTGEINGPILQNGRDQDQSSPHQEMDLPTGALHIADLGYFKLDRFEKDNETGVYWLSRLKTNTVIYQVENEERIELAKWLPKQTINEIDIPILLGLNHKIPCRMFIQRVPQEVADQRRRRMNESARIRGTSVPEERLRLAEWTIIITNVPKEMLALKEALILMRTRWQIELLFKLWKSHSKIDEWRSENPWRILCEIYAKLIGVVLNQWIYSSYLWKLPERSLFRAAKTLQKFAVALTIAINDEAYLHLVLEFIERCLLTYCKQETRKKRPATFQTLLHGLNQHACLA